MTKIGFLKYKILIVFFIELINDQFYS